MKSKICFWWLKYIKSRFSIDTLDRVHWVAPLPKYIVDVYECDLAIFVCVCKWEGFYTTFVFDDVAEVQQSGRCQKYLLQGMIGKVQSPKFEICEEFSFFVGIVNHLIWVLIIEVFVDALYLKCNSFHLVHKELRCVSVCKVPKESMLLLSP